MVGTTIRKWRTEAGLRQEDLERQSGVSQEYISALELGRIAEPGALRLRSLLKALGRKFEELFPPDENEDALRRPAMAA